MITKRSSRSFRFAAAAVGCLTTLTMISAAPPAEAKPAATYRNAVSKSFGDTFADPSVIQGKDGWWYAYSTADPLRAGPNQPVGIMHIARTKDWVTWEYKGTVFNANNRPKWATKTSGLWAPDIRYINNRYVMYYTVTDTTLNPGDDSAIGVATSPTPVGPWTPTDKPVVAPRPDGGGFLWTFDPAGFVDVHGDRYLYYGSYYGGLHVTRVSDDGLTAVGAQTQVAIGDRYEGSYVVRHGGWYYLMASAANCCAGPTTGYSVFSGRSRSPLGPFKDADGISFLDSAVGGTTMVTQNGNKWIGAGHHAIATDTTGRDFMVYHALDRNKPWLNEPFGVTRRPMLIDRIDWINGWPRVRAGRGPSATAQPAPVTGSSLGITATNPAATGFRGLSSGPIDPIAGRTARVDGSAATKTAAPDGRVRLRLDLRGDRPLLVSFGKGHSRAFVTVDPRGDELSVKTGVGRNSRITTTGLSSTSRWRTLVVEFDGSSVLAQVSESDLNDPAAEVRHTHRGFALPSAKIRLRSRGAVVDNFTVRRLATEAKRLAPVPQAGRLLRGDEFSARNSASGTWVRKDPDAVVSGGALNWPLQAADLVGGGNDAGILLYQPPSGDWIAETKVNLDLGVDTIRNYQQAGIMAYDTDDNFARLSSVAIWKTRQTEFGRELVATSDGRTSFGGAVIGTPAPTVWLRLAHTRNRAGEHLYRAGTSRDGRNWTWGAVWTFAANTSPRIGLIAHGGDTPAATAKFDYLRFYAIARSR
jgi:arabinan endo-1,5-alpha-L-arabinosidase